MVVKDAMWPSTERLSLNARELIERLRQEIGGYEARIGVPSDRLEDELRAGRLSETAEIADWLISLKTYRKLMSAGQTRME